MKSASTESEQKPYLFQPGQSGNPKGRPVGSRNKLGEAFLEELMKDFATHGAAAIVEVRETKPDQYLKVIASTLPKDINLNVADSTDELTDEQLYERIKSLSAAIAPFLSSGVGGPAVTQEAQGSAGKPDRVH